MKRISELGNNVSSIRNVILLLVTAKLITNLPVLSIYLVFLLSVLQLLVIFNVVPSSLILFTLTMKAICSSDKPVLTSYRRRHILEDGIHHCKSWISNLTYQTKNKQTPWPLVGNRNIPTERPPLVSEIYCQLLRIQGCRVVRAGDPPRSLVSVF
jgi:hypothetical protein